MKTEPTDAAVYLASLCNESAIQKAIQKAVKASLGDPALISNVPQIARFLGLVSSGHSTGEETDSRRDHARGRQPTAQQGIQSEWVTIRKNPNAFVRIPISYGSLGRL